MLGNLLTILNPIEGDIHTRGRIGIDVDIILNAFRHGDIFLLSLHVFRGDIVGGDGMKVPCNVVETVNI